MKVLHIAAEVAPWSQTGGLAHVTAALPVAQVRAGGGEVSAAIVAPGYRESYLRVGRAGGRLVDTGADVGVWLAGWLHRGRLLRVEPAGEVPIHLLDCPQFYDRDGIYGDQHGEFGDNALRYAMLCRGALDASERLLGGVPDIVNSHDWQGGLAAAYVKTALQPWLAGTRCVFTIHNLAYQGVVGAHRVLEVGLDGWTFTPELVEQHGQLSLMKAGIAFADAVTTVSPSYAAEIVDPWHGMGLDGFIRDHARRLTGILNGIDVADWDPRTDRRIAARYSAETIGDRRRNRDALLAEMGLTAADDEPVLGAVTRLADQKGMDLVAQAAQQLPAWRARLVVLGSGDRHLEDWFRSLASELPGHVAVSIGYDEALSRRIYAGSDAILVPSRFEPCGLAQMYAMRYGALPIAHAVGGLRDTVIDPGDDALARGEGTGILFDHATGPGLEWAIERACELFRRDPAGWRRASASIMAHDVSWDRSAARYLDLYRDTLRA